MKQHILIAMPVSEFEDLIRKCLTSSLPPPDTTAKKTVNTYLTSKETASILKISLPTLRKLTRNSVLKGYRLGKAIRYRSDEVETALRSMKYIKHSRSEFAT